MDWEQTCRVCLEGGDMVSMFDCDGNNELLRDKYKYTTDIEVSESDTLPTLICLTCVDRLMFAYQFKQQSILSNDTLKECLAELTTSSVCVLPGKTNAAGSEVVPIKQENSANLHYELPDDGAGLLKVHGVTPRCRRGRPKKYPNQKEEIVTSTFHGLLDSGDIDDVKEELHGDGSMDFLQDDDDDDDADPDYKPLDHPADHEEPSIAPALAPKKKRRRAKKPPARENEEDVLLKETIMAYSEPLPDCLLKPKEPKPKKSIPDPNEPKPRKIYKRNKSHICETCGKSFTANTSLQAHIRRHLGIKPFVCSVCGTSFVLNMELRLHMMRHTGHKHYKCRICERRFADCGSRQRHERLHLEGRPYQCTLCAKTFGYRSVLNRHMLTHTGEKKFTCAPCNKKFTTAHQLKYHNKIHHKDVYHKQQMEQEAKRLRKEEVKDLSNLLASGQFLEGGNRVQLVQTEGESGEMQRQTLEEGKAEKVETRDTDGSEGEEVHYND